MHRMCSGLGNLKTIKCLLKNGASLDSLDFDGRTPLMYVLGRPYKAEFLNDMHSRPEEVLPFLLKNGNVNIIDNDGRNMLNAKTHKKPRLKFVAKHISKLTVLIVLFIRVFLILF